jgi:hypothetical protein
MLSSAHSIRNSAHSSASSQMRLRAPTPEAIRKIYSTSWPLTKNDIYPSYGNKTFSKCPDNFSNTNEKLHSEHRRMVNNVYSMSTILTLEPYIDNCSRLFLQRIGEFADSHAVIDLGDWLQRYVR